MIQYALQCNVHYVMTNVSTWTTYKNNLQLFVWLYSWRVAYWISNMSGYSLITSDDNSLILWFSLNFVSDGILIWSTWFLWSFEFIRELDKPHAISAIAIDAPMVGIVIAFNVYVLIYLDGFIFRQIVDIFIFVYDLFLNSAHFGYCFKCAICNGALQIWNCLPQDWVCPKFCCRWDCWTCWVQIW